MQGKIYPQKQGKPALSILPSNDLLISYIKTLEHWGYTMFLSKKLQKSSFFIILRAQGFAYKINLSTGQLCLNLFLSAWQVLGGLLRA